MHLTDRMMLLALAALWGLNFSVIKLALADLPPLLLGALRFLLVAVPAVFMLPRPTAPWRHIAAYGGTMFALQFTLLFAGMAMGVGAGTASLLLQAQVFVTIALAVAFGRERPSARQGLGVVLGALGIGGLLLAAMASTPSAGLVLVLLAAASWGVANTLSRRMLVGQSALPLVAWGSLVSVLPVLLASLWLEGWGTCVRALTHSRAETWAAVAYIAYVSTLGGFAVWARQLRRYPAAAVAPFSMLVPVFGMTFSVAMLGEPLALPQLAASALVVAGVAISSLGGRRPASPARARPA
jgi:O-acetylserine/cysteine efflux transporter